MKILLLMESWGGGGTEVYVKGLVEFLKTSGHETHIVFLKPGVNDRDPFLKKTDYSYCSLFNLPAFLKCLCPDICHLQLYTSLLPVAAIARYVSRIPCVATLHMPLSAWGWRFRQSWRLALRICNAVVGVSSQVVGELHGKNIFPLPVPGAIEKFFFGKRSSSQESFRIFAAGRLSREKDWPTLLQAVGSLGRLSKPCVLEHFGGGPLLAELQVLAKTLGVEVIWHGLVPQDMLAKSLSRANLFVLPSRFEGLGLAAVEAMAMGIPTITSDFPASKDFIINGKTGHSFPIGDPRSLSQLIEWHFDNPEASHTIGLNGKAFVEEKFSIDNTYQKYFNIYDKITAK